LGGDNFLEGSPHSSNHVQAGDMGKDLRRYRVQQKTEYLLIPRVPCSIFGVLDPELLSFLVFSLHCFLGCNLCPLNEIKNPSATKGREHQGAPWEKVVAREELCRRRPEESSQGGRRG
jgi:hypothetical protein